MPPISPIKILCNLKFFSHSLKLSNSEWQQPSGDHPVTCYGDSMEVSEKVAIPKTIPPWFMPTNQHKFHQDSCDDVGKAFKELSDAMFDAVQFAHTMWKLQAKFKDLKINAVTALGTPGCLDGPELESLIKNAPMVAAFTGNKAKWRDAIAAGVSKCFKNWQDMVTVPGLPWYPAFAAFPGPMAPPMPNVPMPLIACISGKMADIVAPMTMKSEMENALDGSLKDPDKHYEALFDGIATVLSMAFLCWLPQQQVMLVLGKGPIPTFAPPFVPVGPVIMGDNLPLPGHLMA
jgi:hypothetical protein